eukprot:7219391-Prymnesium_polylepis.1
MARARPAYPCRASLPPGLTRPYPLTANSWLLRRCALVLELDVLDQVHQVPVLALVFGAPLIELLVVLLRVIRRPYLHLVVEPVLACRMLRLELLLAENHLVNVVVTSTHRLSVPRDRGDLPAVEEGRRLRADAKLAQAAVCHERHAICGLTLQRRLLLALRMALVRRVGKLRPLADVVHGHARPVIDDDDRRQPLPRADAAG